MIILISIVHVLVCIFLILVVLVQGGRGAELGAAFGGSSQTLFGGRGATTFLSKLTTAAAALFMVTSLVLTVASIKGKGTVVPQTPVRQMPGAPGLPPGGQPFPGPQSGVPQQGMPGQPGAAQPQAQPGAGQPNQPGAGQLPGKK
ncbi:MAG: preprotein translocase subunit SecG [Nitrospiraceae bacterium]|nr:preprotein translocase subunit SecG [Nitrospiraceae bacterium]